MFKHRIFKALLILDLLAILGCVAVYQSDRMQRCHDAPLALGLHVTWFGDNLQFNEGYHEIISSSKGNEPFPDTVVKGAELYKKILEYGLSDYDKGVFFRASDWDGKVQTFLLQKYPYNDDTQYSYEVVMPTGQVPVDEWVKVDELTCLIWIFPAIPILVGVATFMLYGALLFWGLIRGLRFLLTHKPSVKD